jgi:hypothetical protein
VLKITDRNIPRLTRSRNALGFPQTDWREARSAEPTPRTGILQQIGRQPKIIRVMRLFQSEFCRESRVVILNDEKVLTI